jgi:hypothetical protein
MILLKNEFKSDPDNKECLAEEWGIEHTFSMPLLDGIAKNEYAACSEHPGPQTLYKELASALVSEVAKTKSTIYGQMLSTIRRTHDSGRRGSISPASMRRGCRAQPVSKK